jgi:hypothetical protein
MDFDSKNTLEEIKKEVKDGKIQQNFTLFFKK